jgi:hypothetical protein
MTAKSPSPTCPHPAAGVRCMLCAPSAPGSAEPAVGGPRLMLQPGDETSVTLSEVAQEASEPCAMCGGTGLRVTGQSINPPGPERTEPCPTCAAPPATPPPGPVPAPWCPVCGINKGEVDRWREIGDRLASLAERSIELDDRIDAFTARRTRPAAPPATGSAAAGDDAEVRLRRVTEAAIRERRASAAAPPRQETGAKPCPFCGSAPFVSGPTSVKCRVFDCPISSRRMTLAEWNRRPTPPPAEVEAERDRMRTALAYELDCAKGAIATMDAKGIGKSCTRLCCESVVSACERALAAREATRGETK